MGFFARVLPTEILCFALVTTAVSSLPGGVSLHPAKNNKTDDARTQIGRRTRKLPHGNFAKVGFIWAGSGSVDYVHCQDHGTVALAAKVAALPFKVPGLLWGDVDFGRLPFLHIHLDIQVLDLEPVRHIAR